MKKAERAEYVLQKLTQLYPNPPIPLDHTNEFTLLVAVLLSAQCADAVDGAVFNHVLKYSGLPMRR